MATLIRLRIPSYASSPNPITSSSSSSTSRRFVKMVNQNQSVVSLSTSSSVSVSSPAEAEKNKKLPILLFDVMDTIVRDPFYQDIPHFFKMSFNELIECKHPTAWVEFEKGQINESELARKFFKDGRPFDLEGLKDCMKRGYSYIDGIEALLHSLKQNNYEMHAFTNYPSWYTMIEDKLKVSTYMSWTFCSCRTGKRKPEADAYLEVLRHLEVEPASCIFVDDRMANVEAAVNAGIVGLHFRDASSLRQKLIELGIEISTKNDDANQDVTEARKD